MLKNEVETIDLYQLFEAHWPAVESELSEEIKQDAEIIASPEAARSFSFPALRYPQKIVSFNLDKSALLEGRLDAIKGQYLILDSGVINIRKYAGYLVNMERL